MKELFKEIIRSKAVPDRTEYLALVEKVIETMEGEDSSIRPPSEYGGPGGIVNLLTGVPTIIVPDLHARREFIGALIETGNGEGSFFELMREERLQVVCVGDGFHREVNGKERWQEAFQEYQKSYKKHKNIDEEMTESLGLMEMVIRLKTAFPRNFHFLKGNHENIGNMETGGDHPFRKFAYEGDMVKTWILQFMGEEFLKKYSRFERSLPLFAIGENFLISHAEPSSLFYPDEIRDYDDATIHGLTWTANGEAEEGSVRSMLEYYLPDIALEDKLYFGGHRTISGKYRLRADGLYVQIHNPWKYQVVYLKPGKKINLEEDIIELPGNE